ncbi:uncharacterized protein METZ01_LOCUS297435 [marine metagenome]|uniref:Uncharacterized protein n=1 Tax=marine metagenome TaxID=408172 RepID=A0A382MBG0_9ZZZZ
MVDVNRAQPNFSKNYREPSLIIRIGLDLEQGQWCEKIYMDGCQRLPDRTLVGDVIGEHNRIFEKHGRVLFGRFEVLSPRWQNAMHSFLHTSCPRLGGKLMIILRKGETYEGFTTRVFKFEHFCDEPELVPGYYRDLSSDMFTWFQIGELTPMHSNELAKYTEDIVYAIKRKRTLSKTLASAGY